MKIRPAKYLTTALLTTALAIGGCLSDSKDGGLTQSAAPPVVGTNRAPTISGNPSLGIKVGEAYSFTPNASDADGDTLTFSITNKPSWASFNTGSGALTGTPTLVDVGSFSSIRISVSDGTDSTSLNAFAIDVTQVALGSTTLSWTAPTENEDGSTLQDLAGFKIYYGRSSGNYSNEIRINNPSVTTYLVDNLSPDTYYFSATAFNGAGIESGFATEVFKDVN
jgi:hypothetical protein